MPSINSKIPVVLAVVVVGAIGLVVVGGGFLSESTVTVQATLVESPADASPKYTLEELGEDDPVEIASERALTQNSSGSLRTSSDRLQNNGIPQEPFFVKHHDQWIRITFQTSD